MLGSLCIWPKLYFCICDTKEHCFWGSFIITFQKIFGLYGLKSHILENRLAVTLMDAQNVKVSQEFCKEEFLISHFISKWQKAFQEKAQLVNDIAPICLPPQVTLLSQYLVEPAWLWESFPEVRNRKGTESGLHHIEALSSGEPKPIISNVARGPMVFALTSILVSQLWFCSQ